MKVKNLFITTMEIVLKDVTTSTSIQDDLMLPNNVKNGISIEDNKIRYTDDQIDKDLLKPFKYLTSIPGKNIRADFIKTLNYWYQIPEDKLTLIDQIFYNAHNISLLMDDIQDASVLRRGIPAAHTIYGIINTMNSVTFVSYFTVMEQARSLNHPKALRLALEGILEACTGQGMDVYWRDKFECPTEDEYNQMVTKKTTYGFFAVTKLMQLFSKKTGKDFTKFAYTLGLYFQINDDYQNLNNQYYFDSKGFCDDISEGKFGFPVVHAVNTHPKKSEMIMEILSQKTQDVRIIKQCLSLLDECGSFEYTRNRIKELKNIIFEETQTLGENPFINTLMKKIINE